MKVLLASGNAKKLHELQRIVEAEHLPLEVVGLGDVEPYDEPLEDADSFQGNALIKARAGAVVSGLPTIADDSGLEVDALNGMPGILSARWSGHHGDDVANLELVLAQISDVPAPRRGARFVSVCALVSPDGTEVIERGEMAGRLVFEPRGQNGFGYDPIFVPDGYEVTTAELTADEKDSISHRGKALRALVPALKELVA